MTNERESSKAAVPQPFGGGSMAPHPPRGIPPARGRAQVDNTSDLTRPGADGYYRPDSFRADLSQKLVEIRSMDGVRFVFNDTVDRRTLRVEKAGSGKGNTLSIRYTEDVDGKEDLAGAAALKMGTSWTENRGGKITSYGQYAWESDRTLIVGPPEGGWPQGKFVRFEFDRSVSDDAGNRLVNDQDQIIIASVRSEIYCTIVEPSAETTYLRWDSGDEVLGRPEDFTVFVAGQVVQRGASEHVREIEITATSNKGLTVSYKIYAGDIERRELSRGIGGSDWVPGRNFSGRWAIMLPLQHPDWRGKGCQAVVEGHHTWTISATVFTASGVEIAATNRRVVVHELFRPRVLMVYCPQIRDHNGILYHWRHGKALINRLRFTRHDLGLKQFIIRLDGHFEQETIFSYVNTYISASATQQILHWEMVYDAELKREVVQIYLPGFNIHDRIRDILAGGQYRNRMVHTLSISIRTRASFAIYFSFEFFVDTIPLDVETVEAVRMGFAGADVGLIEREVSGYENGQIDLWKEYASYRSSTAMSGGVTSATTISYESTEVVESYSETVIEERSEERYSYGELIEVDLPPFYDESRGGIYGDWPAMGGEVRLCGRLMRRWHGRQLQFPALYDDETGLLFYLRGNFGGVGEGEYIVVRGLVFGQVQQGCGVDIIDVSLEGPREIPEGDASDEEMIQLVVNDLAEQLRVPASEVRVLKVEPATFINGVPRPGGAEVRIMGGYPVEGLRVTLAVAKATYNYEVDVRRSFRLNDKARQMSQASGAD